MAEALPFQGGSAPQPLLQGQEPECPMPIALAVSQQAQASEKMQPQSPASSRLRPIRTAKDAANRTAAWVNVGGAGAKTGAATSVGGIINTFDECGELWKWAGVSALYGRFRR